jgi:hypothetical protein
MRGGFAVTMTQIIQPAPTYLALRDQFDLVDQRRVCRENPLNTDTVRHLAHGKSSIGRAFAFTYDHTLEDLDTLFVAFLDPDVHGHGVSRLEIREINPHLFAIQHRHGVHFIPPKSYLRPKSLSTTMPAADLTDR